MPLFLMGGPPPRKATLAGGRGPAGRAAPAADPLAAMLERVRRTEAIREGMGGREGVPRIGAERRLDPLLRAPRLTKLRAVERERIERTHRPSVRLREMEGGLGDKAMASLMELFWDTGLRQQTGEFLEMLGEAHGKPDGWSQAMMGWMDQIRRGEHPGTSAEFGLGDWLSNELLEGFKAAGPRSREVAVRAQVGRPGRRMGGRLQSRRGGDVPALSREVRETMLGDQQTGWPSDRQWRNERYRETMTMLSLASVAEFDAGKFGDAPSSAMFVSPEHAHLVRGEIGALGPPGLIKLLTEAIDSGQEVDISSVFEELAQATGSTQARKMSTLVRSKGPRTFDAALESWSVAMSKGEAGWNNAESALRQTLPKDTLVVVRSAADPNNLELYHISARHGVRRLRDTGEAGAEQEPATSYNAFRQMLRADPSIQVSVVPSGHELVWPAMKLMREAREGKFTPAEAEPSRAWERIEQEYLRVLPPERERRLVPPFVGPTQLLTQHGWFPAGIKTAFRTTQPSAGAIAERVRSALSKMSDAELDRLLDDQSNPFDILSTPTETRGVPLLQPQDAMLAADYINDFRRDARNIRSWRLLGERHRAREGEPWLGSQRRRDALVEFADEYFGGSKQLVAPSSIFYRETLGLEGGQ